MTVAGSDSGKAPLWNRQLAEVVFGPSPCDKREVVADPEGMRPAEDHSCESFVEQRVRDGRDGEGVR
jgi:hypothetical protein